MFYFDSNTTVPIQCAALVFFFESVRDNFHKHIMSLLSSLGYAYIWNNVNVVGVILNDIVQRLKDQYIQNWFSQLANYAKLDTYRIFKSTFKSEKYITCLNNRCHCYSLARCIDVQHS